MSFTQTQVSLRRAVRDLASISRIEEPIVIASLAQLLGGTLLPVTFTYGGEQLTASMAAMILESLIARSPSYPPYKRVTPRKWTTATERGKPPIESGTLNVPELLRCLEFSCFQSDVPRLRKVWKYGQSPNGRPTRAPKSKGRPPKLGALEPAITNAATRFYELITETIRWSSRKVSENSSFLQMAFPDKGSFTCESKEGKKRDAAYLKQYGCNARFVRDTISEVRNARTSV